MRKPTLTGTIIGAVAIVVAALIGIYPSIRKQNTTQVIAGMVVEQSTNRGIGQATILLAGRTEEYVTEDSGNFRIQLQASAPNRVRLHVTKVGFQPLDITVEPQENLILQLRKQ